MLIKIPMRYIFVAMAALGLVIATHSRVANSQSVTDDNEARSETTTPFARNHHCAHGCKHLDEARTVKTMAKRYQALASQGVLWESHLPDPSAAPESMTITDPTLTPKVYQAGTRQHLTLDDGTQLEIDILHRHIHNDGTLAISGTVVGKPQGRLHMQWNDADDFFLGQIEYNDLPIAYEITRGNDGSHLITRRSITDLVCSEVDTTTGIVRYGLPALPESLNLESADSGAGSESNSESEAEAPSLVPSLNSYPSATAVVYLDFDGEQVTGTSWGSNISAAATGYSASKITSIWQRVAADMEPFNLNVTTDESVYLSAPAAKRIRCIITPSNEWYGSNTAGGVAKFNSFTWSGDTPCWVFSDNLANGTKYIAEACSHEVGHTFGLSHDGKTGSTYYAGHGSGAVGWAPIMGSSYFKSMTQWSKGEYSSATNTQNDLSIITSGNGFGYRSDDHASQASSATHLSANASQQISAIGNIERTGDVDVFEFETGAGQLSLSVTQASSFGNLDIHADLYDINGQLIATSNPATQLNADISTTVGTGSYFLHVRATGYGSANTGFTDYASLGAYNVSGTVAVSTVPTPYELTVASLPETDRDPLDDPDGDGRNNLTEHALGSDPAIPQTSPAFAAMEPDGSGDFNFILDLPTDIPTDVTYVVEASCTMTDNDWASIATRSGGSWSGTATVTEEMGPAGARRFRVTENSGGPWTCRFVRLNLEISSQAP